MITVSIPVLTSVLVLAILILICTRFRTGFVAIMKGAAAGIEIFLRSAWNFLSGATPAAGNAVAGTVSFFKILLAIVLVLALFLILIFLAVHVLIAWSILAVGDATGHQQVAMYFLVAIIIWGAFARIPKMLVFQPLLWISRWIARPIAILLIFYLLWGVAWHVFTNVSPRLASSVSRSSNNTIEKVIIRLDENSSHSEPEVGSIRKMKENTFTIPSRAGIKSFIAKSGEFMKIVSWNGRPATADHEGFTEIMAKNDLGHYDGSKIGWVPTRLIEQSWETPAEGYPSAASVVSATSVPAPATSPPVIGSTPAVPATPTASASVPSSPPAVSTPVPTAVASTPSSPPVTPAATSASSPITSAAPSSPTPAKSIGLDGILLLKGECRSITSGIGMYSVTGPMGYAGDGKNFVPISGGQFKVESSDANPRVRALEGGTFTVRKL